MKHVTLRILSCLGILLLIAFIPKAIKVMEEQIMAHGD